MKGSVEVSVTAVLDDFGKKFRDPVFIFTYKIATHSEIKNLIGI